ALPRSISILSLRPGLSRRFGRGTVQAREKHPGIVLGEEEQRRGHKKVGEVGEYDESISQKGLTERQQHQQHTRREQRCVPKYSEHDKQTERDFGEWQHVTKGFHQ